MQWAPSAALLTLVMAFSSACGDGGGATTDATPDYDAPAPVPDAMPSIDAFRADATVPPPGARCSNPIELSPGDSHTYDTSSLPDFITTPCSAGTSVGPDAIYLLDVGATPRDLIVTATTDETIATPFDIVLHARTDCTDNTTGIGCVDAAWSERLELLDVAGQIYVIVDGTDQFGGSNAGPYTLETATRDVVSSGATCDPAGITSRCVLGDRCVGGTCTTDSPAVACASATQVSGDLTAGVEYTGTTQTFEANHYTGSCAAEPAGNYPEHIYEITLAQTSNLIATTNFAETTLDTYLYLRDACDGSELGCHDDVDLEGHNLTSTLMIDGLAPGTYYLFVDGSSAFPGVGSYRLSITATAP